jgi:hypothetical protein
MNNASWPFLPVIHDAWSPASGTVKADSTFRAAGGYNRRTQKNGEGDCWNNQRGLPAECFGLPAI